MSFDAAQTTLIHELLEIFQGGTFDWFDYNDWVTGEITSVPLNSPMDLSVARDKLTDILAAIVAAAPTDGREARIKEVLTEYGCVALNEITVGPGGTSAVPGARFSTSKQRTRLRELLQLNTGIRMRMMNARRDGRNLSVGR